MKKHVLVLTTIMALSTSGCSVFNSAGNDKLHITCDVDGEATIIVNGRSYHENMVVASVDKGESASVICKANGYRTASTYVDTKLSSAGWWDAIGTLFFVVPVFGFAADGAWTLEQDTVYLSPQLKQFQVAPVQQQPATVVIHNNNK